MNNKIRLFLLKEIKKRYFNLSTFAQQANLNRGVLSATLREHSSKPISFLLFQKIVQALDCDEELALKYYIEECFHSGKPNRSRVEPFLIRCGELRLVCYIKEVSSRLLNNDSDWCNVIFEVGEKLYLLGLSENSVPFYEQLIQHEKYIQSEQLAISHYRLFRIRVCEQNESNLIIATRFVPFYEKLPNDYKLDAAMKLINVYTALKDLEQMEHWTQNLFSLTHFLYDRAIEVGWNEIPQKMDYSFVVYYGYAYLSVSSYLIELERYLEAKTYVEKFENLNWFPKLDEQGKKEIERFTFYANMTYFCIELGLGNGKRLIEYVTFLDENPEQILSGLPYILKYANQFDNNIDEILEHFQTRIQNYPYMKTVYKNNPAVTMNLYVDVCIDIALYYHEHSNYSQALKYAKYGVDSPAGIEVSKKLFTRLAPIFEKFPILIHSD